MNHALPGADLIEKGLADLRQQQETVEALLVAIGAPRLRSIGLDIPRSSLTIPSIAFTNWWHMMISIPRIRATMHSFVD